MSNDTIWLPWIGLPHELGADPRLGKSACCLRMAELLHTDAGRSFPDVTTLLTQARAGNWDKLKTTFYKLCTEVETPKTLDLALVNNGKIGLGIGTIVDNNYLLIPHHKRGVVAIPLNLLKPMKFYRLNP